MGVPVPGGLKQALGGNGRWLISMVRRAMTIIYGTSADDVIRGFEGADTVYGGPEAGVAATGRTSSMAIRATMSWTASDGDDTVYGGQDEDNIGGRHGQ